MDINLFVVAIPFFLLMIAVEFFISNFLKIALYELKDFANNISAGILEEAFCLPLQGILLFNYQSIYQHHALFLIDPKSIFNWVLLWLAADFLYYWFHRASHRNTFLWIGHSVHHQSEHFNLSVALRQGIVQTLFTWIIYLPLAWLGFPTWMFLLITSANTLYQFWIHTVLIKRLGWLEFLFNTPSHHRVHHGRNPQYIDKNYGGSLIIWDRLFGTFEKEEEAVLYGVTEPLNSLNPFYANVKVIADVLYYGKHLPSWRELILAFFRPPEWLINQLGKDKFQHYHQARTPGRFALNFSQTFVFVNTLILVLVYSYYLVMFGDNLALTLLSGSAVMATLLQIALVLKHGMNSLIQGFELLRILLCLIFVHILWQNLQIDLGLVLVFLGLWVTTRKSTAFNEVTLPG